MSMKLAKVHVIIFMAPFAIKGIAYCFQQTFQEGNNWWQRQAVDDSNLFVVASEREEKKCKQFFLSDLSKHPEQGFPVDSTINNVVYMLTSIYNNETFQP